MEGSFGVQLAENDTGGSMGCVPGSYVGYHAVDPSIVENITSPSPAVEFSAWEKSLKITFYVLSFVVAVCGNGMVILAVIFNKKMKTTTNCLILNLAISDLLVGLCCMWIHLGSSISSIWPFGAAACKTKLFLQVLVVTSSTLTLTVIAGDRLIAIVFPLHSRLSPLATGLMVCLTWLVSTATALPQLIVTEERQLWWKDRKEIWCEENWPRMYINENCDTTEPGRKIYYTVYVVLIYLCPVIFMVGAYTLIMITIVNRKLPGAVTDSMTAAQDKSKRKVVRMLMGVVVTFIVCWTPQQIFLLWEVYRTPGKYSTYIDGLKYAALYIAYSNSAVNPVIYGGLNEHFRRSFVQISKCTRLRNRNRVVPETVPDVVETHVEINQVQTNL